MERKDCKEEILSVNVKKDSRNEKIKKKKDEDGEKKESSI